MISRHWFELNWERFFKAAKVPYRHNKNVHRLVVEDENVVQRLGELEELIIDTAQETYSLDEVQEGYYTRVGTLLSTRVGIEFGKAFLVGGEEYERRREALLVDLVLVASKMEGLL